MNATAIARGPQHMRALARANQVRLARADLKRRVMEGETTAAAVILDSPWEVENMAVAELLMSQHRWGHTRARRFLSGIPISETKTIGSMTDRQRRALADLLETQSPAAVSAAPDQLLV
ncbi:MAG TPA: hypothetical protein VID68_05020 [Solirubrobacteraceae bacterium]|jgi:hypothetical protein